MTERTGPRCPYTLHIDYRPVLAAVATARAAGRPAPPTDWRCAREPHLTTGGEQHLAMPLGVTGRSVRFSDTSAEPLSFADVLGDQPPPALTAAGGWCAPASYFLDPTYLPVDVPPSVSTDGYQATDDADHRAGVYCGEPAHCTEPYPGALPGTPYANRIPVVIPVPVVHPFHAADGQLSCDRTLRNGHRCGGTPDDHRVYAAPPRRHADPADVAALIEMIERPGTSCLHIADGDELLLLMPEGDDAAIEQATRALSDLFPTVSFLVLQGITGAIRMPRSSSAPRWLAMPEPGRAAYEALATDHADLAAQRQHLVDQGVPPADLLHPRRPIPPLGYQPPPRQA